MELDRFYFILFLLFWVCHSIAQLINEDICGTTTILESRIIGGRGVEMGEFPWMAYIQKPENETHRSFCGGSLINKQFVLSAAHCYHYAYAVPEQINVYLGLIKVSSGENVDPTVGSIRRIYGIRDVYIYDDYDPSQSFIHDVALIQFNEEVEYTAYIRPICLPLRIPNYDVRIEIGAKAIIAGWGCTRYGGGASDDLLKSTVLINPLQACGVFDTRWNVHRLCAGERNSSNPCEGDSGGPLMKAFPRFERPRYFHFGIVSEGRGNYPANYPKTSFYVLWIKRTIQSYILPRDSGDQC